jgi:hypothetical protein
VQGDNNLTTVEMTPFLVTAALAKARKAMLAQHADDLLCATDWERVA